MALGNSIAALCMIALIISSGALVLSVSSLERPQVVQPDNDNAAFFFVEKSCTISTATTQMAGFKLNYTTGASGRIAIMFDFGIDRPTSGASSYRLAFGTGAAPACNAAGTGTATGDFHLISNAPASNGFIVGVDTYAATLTPNTAYWFDLSINDSSTSLFIYRDAEITIIQN